MQIWQQNGEEAIRHRSGSSPGVTPLIRHERTRPAVCQSTDLFEYESFNVKAVGENQSIAESQARIKASPSRQIEADRHGDYAADHPGRRDRRPRQRLGVNSVRMALTL